jgi:hypothetical protein
MIGVSKMAFMFKFHCVILIIQMHLLTYFTKLKKRIKDMGYIIIAT